MKISLILPCLFCLAGLTSLSSAASVNESCESELTPLQLNLLESIRKEQSLKTDEQDFQFSVFRKSVQGVPRLVVLVADNPVKRKAAATAKWNLIRAFPYVTAPPYATKVPDVIIRRLDSNRSRADALYDRNHEYRDLIPLAIPPFDSKLVWVTDEIAQICASYILPFAATTCVISYFVGEPSLILPALNVGAGAVAVWALLDPDRGLLTFLRRQKYDGAVFAAIEEDLANQPHVQKSLVFVDYQRFSKISKSFEINGWNQELKQ